MRRARAQCRRRLGRLVVSYLITECNGYPRERGRYRQGVLILGEYSTGGIYVSEESMTVYHELYLSIPDLGTGQRSNRICIGSSVYVDHPTFFGVLFCACLLLFIFNCVLPTSTISLMELAIGVVHTRACYVMVQLACGCTHRYWNNALCDLR